MKASLEQLLKGVIDYAGLFPPAKLPMREALEAYCDYRAGSECWLVSRFICPARRLMELERELARVEDDGIPLSVVGSGGRDMDELESNLELDVAEMNRFEDAVGTRCEIEAFEIRCPSSEDADALAADLDGFGEIEAYVELPWDDSMHEGLVVLAETEWLGAKARTGGLEPAAFPPVKDLTLFLRDCLNLDLPFKLTAGLHHPIRHRNSMGADEHGFLNVLCATALASAHDLNSSEIEKILADSRGDAFEFTDSGVRWRDWEATTEDIEGIRSLFVSYGSCSVDEPLDGLEELGLLGVRV